MSRLVTALAMFGAAGVAVAEPEFRVIGTRSMAAGGEFVGTEVGGLSGIDYHAPSDQWFAICDDGGRNGTPRAYKLKVEFNEHAIQTFRLYAVKLMTFGDGAPYEVDAFDPEAIRFISDPVDPEGEPTLLWTSEGNARRGIAPALLEMCTGATWMEAWPVADHFRPTSDESSGARHNLGFESLALMPDEQTAFVATEDALAQDAGLGTALTPGAMIRLVQYPAQGVGSEALREFAYRLDQPPERLSPAARNGLVELESIDDTRLLAMERSYSPLGTATTLHVVDLEGAKEVTGSDRIDERTPAVTKRLVLDLSDLRDANGRRIPMANYEGMCFGPDLPTGEKSLVLISDNNFSEREPTRIVVLGVSGL